MAICYAHQTVVRAEAGSSAVGLAAYMMREKMTDTVTGAGYSFQHLQEKNEEVCAGVVLPAGAAAELMDPQALWNSATAAELTVDRKTGETRFKRGAQISWHVILALPKEVTLDQATGMTRQWIEHRYGAAGVAVQWAIHDEAGNPHVHLQVSTRRLSAAGWGKKAREIAPGVRGGQAAFVAAGDKGELVAAWEQFQNDWFLEHGMDLSVDPKLVVTDTRVVAREGDSEQARASDEARSEAAERMRDPEQVLLAIGRMQSTWTRRDVERLVRRQGLDGEDLEAAVDAALFHDGSVALADAVTGAETGRWSTRAILVQERTVLERAKRMSQETFRPARESRAKELAATLTLSAEQQAVLRRETTGGGRLAVIQGRAGTGKSHTLNALRQLHEASGHRVVGVAPTNVVARSMSSDGFRTAMTGHMTLISLAREWDSWDRKTVVVVDEAAMLSTEILDRVLREADRAGARIVLVGDDRQLQSVERGGLFAPIANLAGAAELREVRRQEVAWQRAASEAFAAGDMAAGVEAYAEHGCIAWSKTLAESRAALVRGWAAASAADPDTVRFIYTSTNAEVRRLNEAVRAIRVERGEISAGLAFETARGPVRVAAGDRIQFHGTDRRSGIFNGVLATVTEVREDRIRVRTDDGTDTSWDPRVWQDWSHGYAGTVYRGQGKTQVEVHALYDHAYAWSPSASYVALTRQTRRLTLHVPREMAADQRTLVRQMGTARRVAASVDFAESVRAEATSADVAVNPSPATTRTSRDMASLADSIRRQTKRFELESLVVFCVGRRQDRSLWVVEGQDRLRTRHEQAKAALAAWPDDMDASKRAAVEQYAKDYPAAMAVWESARTFVADAAAVRRDLAKAGGGFDRGAVRKLLERADAIEADAGRPWHAETLRLLAEQIDRPVPGPDRDIVSGYLNEVRADLEAGMETAAWRGATARLAGRVEAARADAGTWNDPVALSAEVEETMRRWPADQERDGAYRVFETFARDVERAEKARERVDDFVRSAEMLRRRVRTGAGGADRDVRKLLERADAIEADAGRPWYPAVEGILGARIIAAGVETPGASGASLAETAAAYLKQLREDLAADLAMAEGDALVSELADAWSGPMLQAAAEARKAVAQAGAARDPDPHRDARLRRHLWGLAVRRAGQAAAVYEANGSAVEAEMWRREEAAAKAQQAGHDTRAALIGAWMEMEARCGEARALPDPSSYQGLVQVRGVLDTAIRACRNFVDRVRDGLVLLKVLPDHTAAEELDIRRKSWTAEERLTGLTATRQPVAKAADAIALWEKKRKGAGWRSAVWPLHEAEENGRAANERLARAAHELVCRSLAEADKKEKQAARQQQRRGGWSMRL